MDKEFNILKYSDYDLDDFLADEFFISWAKNPDGKEGHFWGKWIAENPDHRETVMVAASIIRSLGLEKRPTLSDKAYLEIFENVLRYESFSEPTHPLTKEKNAWLKWFKFHKVAATLLFAFCAWAVIQVYINDSPEELPAPPVQWNVRENSAGFRSSLKLNDGSIITLNSNSKLTFPEQFSDTLRLVKLEGEAFFDIKENGSPFIVELGGTNVEVLGTTFNVRYPMNGELSVALVSGKVKVKDESGNQVILKPSEMLKIHQNGELSLTSFDPMEVVGWKDKLLVFRKSGKQEIIQKISSWYGVTVTCECQKQESWAYTGEYQDESLPNVLEGIKRALDIDYEISGKQVTLSTRKR